MTIDDIERLLLRLDRTDIASVEIDDGASRLTLRRAAPGRTAPSPPAESAPIADASPALKATAFGRLRLHHPEAAPAAETSYPRAVMAGDIVAFLEAGLLLRPVIADRDGTLGPPLAPEGALIGYGTSLFPLS